MPHSTFAVSPATERGFLKGSHRARRPLARLSGVHYAVIWLSRKCLKNHKFDPEASQEAPVCAKTLSQRIGSTQSRVFG